MSYHLRADPIHDPRVKETSALASACFAEAARHFDTPCEAVAIPYAGTTLPGYWYRVDDSSTKRPTLVFHGGFDSTVEELYFAGAAAALRRGYNVLTFDGPG